MYVLSQYELAEIKSYSLEELESYLSQLYSDLNMSHLQPRPFTKEHDEYIDQLTSFINVYKNEIELASIISTPPFQSKNSLKEDSIEIQFLII
jgi:hypothetical protein